ncbi:MAG: TIGR03936 family radical SAM-associated protein [Actinomycetota bacterium]
MYKLRVKYGKFGILRFLSHLETVRAFERAVRRANLPFALTKGFSPKLKISWGPPLPLGFSSCAEYADFFLAGYLNPERIIDSLNKALPRDIRILEAKYVPLHSASLMSIIDVASYKTLIKVDPSLSREELKDGMDGLLNRGRISVFKKDRERAVDLRRLLLDFEVEEVKNGEVTLKFSLQVGGKESIRPENLIKALFERFPKSLSFEIIEITRMSLYEKVGDELIDPLRIRKATSE